MRGFKKRKSEPIPLGDLVPRLFGERAHAVTVSIVSAVWERVLPARVVKNASPTFLKEGTLHVETTTSTWAQEVQLMSPTIVAKLQAALPRITITSIRAKTGPYPKRAQPDTSRPPKITPLREDQLPAALKKELDRIEDDAVRAAVTKAARQSLAHDKAR